MSVKQYQGLGVGGNWVYGMAKTDTKKHIDGYVSTQYVIEGRVVFKDSIGIYVGQDDVKGKPLYVGDIVDIMNGERFTGVRGVIEWRADRRQMEVVVYSDFSVLGLEVHRYPMLQIERHKLVKTGHHFEEMQKSYLAMTN
ncbi:hypothetical protein [Bacillus thuringiensis]|uniref:hypothetical protein n=1 Tax=Bacillus thuringiensis TaxID=1428 RepID=UPI000BFC42B3|nr:hypothetical protein [Bacillus thuringiensis]PGT89829.1 hypothetical protein COD17_08760 [Bacillus thuringiensis]